jgi:hypothetical protein
MEHLKCWITVISMHLQNVLQYVFQTETANRKFSVYQKEKGQFAFEQLHVRSKWQHVQQFLQRYFSFHSL